jgi:[protein]-arginine 3-hydroxylase / protease
LKEDHRRFDVVIMAETDDAGGLWRRRPGMAPVLALLQEATQALAQGIAAQAEARATVAMDLCHEKLYEGHWKDVAVEWRQLYARAAGARAQALRALGDVLGALRTCDLGLLLGAPCPGLDLHALAGKLSAQLPATEHVCSPPACEDVVLVAAERAVPRLVQPALLHFQHEHMEHGQPVVLAGCMEHWPALNK